MCGYLAKMANSAGPARQIGQRSQRADLGSDRRAIPAKEAQGPLAGDHAVRGESAVASFASAAGATHGQLNSTATRNFLHLCRVSLQRGSCDGRTGALRLVKEQRAGTDALRDSARPTWAHEAALRTAPGVVHCAKRRPRDSFFAGCKLAQIPESDYRERRCVKATGLLHLF